MSEHKEIIDLCAIYGWQQIHSRNPYMISFRKDETLERLNYYFTTSTATINDTEGGCKVFRKIDIHSLEKIL